MTRTTRFALQWEKAKLRIRQAVETAAEEIKK